MVPPRSLVVFVGPSASREELQVIGPACFLPPARQGDVWSVLQLRPRAILLIDGVFEQAPSVWHRELVAAAESGVAVFGAASMGALRAAELDRHGMIGVGQIYRWYRDGLLVDDGEVALLHADQEHGFRPLTIPLVNVRHAAAAARAEGALNSREANLLVTAGGEVFYQERLWPRVMARLRGRWSAGCNDRWRRWASAPLPDLKRLDALAGMRIAREFMAAPEAPAPRSSPSRPSSLVRRRHPTQQRLGPAGDLPSTRELGQAGIRTLLLAGWGRTLGLAIPNRYLEAARRELAANGSGNDAAELERWAEDLAMEQRVIDLAERMLPDGPSQLDGLALARSINPSTTQPRKATGGGRPTLRARRGAGSPRGE